jgi:hypothetical protein
MESLEDLARKKFSDPPLSAAEERVVRAASNGTEADCRDLGGGDDPAKADGTARVPKKWPQTRNVRADLIRWLCIDREAREQIDARGLLIQGARIAEPLDLSFTNVPFPLAMFDCRLDQPLNFQWAKFALLSLEGSWTGQIFADGLNVQGGLFLRNHFHAEGEVRLLGATIGADLDATGGTFRNSNGKALNAAGVNVTGSVFIKQGLNAKGVAENKFVAEGEVVLVGATIGGELDAAGGTFRNPAKLALNAGRIEVAGSVYLRRGFSADGEVRLTSAEIKGQLAVVDAWIDELKLESARVTGTLFWRNIHKDHKDRHPDFPNKEWKPHLNLADAKAGALVDQEASWPEKGRLILDGFVYGSVADGPIDAKTRLDWLHLQPDWLGFRPQPYEQLIAVLRQMGHEHQVAEVAIAKQNDLYDNGDLGRWGKFRSWVLCHAVGYGYEPWRAFMWMAILVIVGALVFSVARLPSVRVMVPSDKEAYESDQTVKTPLPQYYPRFHAFVYSLDVIFPFDLGQKSHWRLNDKQSSTLAYWLFEFYSLIQLFVGWVLLLVAAAVPAGLIKKD